MERSLLLELWSLHVELPFTGISETDRESGTLMWLSHTYSVGIRRVGIACVGTKAVELGFKNLAF